MIVADETSRCGEPSGCTMISTIHITRAVPAGCRYCLDFFLRVLQPALKRGFQFFSRSYVRIRRFWTPCEANCGRPTLSTAVTVANVTPSSSPPPPPRTMDDDSTDGPSVSAGRTTSQSFKVVLLGEGCVGKTSLVLRYTEDKFSDKHASTLQASFVKKKLNLNGRRVNLAIWDTAGQERFHALGPIYYRMSNGAILVYDITDEDSFQKVKNWIKELKKMLGSEICLVIAGNKIDLEKDRTVSIEDAENYARSVGAVHFHSSAKMNSGIEEIFLSLCRMMIEKADKQSADSLVSLNRSGSTRRTIMIDDEDALPLEEPTRWCCNS